MQSSVAISGDGTSWWLVNASPDLPAQIENFAPLQPRERNARNSPIAGVLLTNADIDHALGVLLMRQREDRVPVYATSEARAKLEWLEKLMQRFCGMEWRNIPTRPVSLMNGAEFRGIELPRSVAFEIRSNSGRRTLLAPAVSVISGELYHAIESADDVFFDGTFWSNDELFPYRHSARTAIDMGHIPIERSLPVLSLASATRKVYLHINNTNPILTPGSPQQRQLEATGAMAGYDGLEFQL